MSERNTHLITLSMAEHALPPMRFTLASDVAAGALLHIRVDRQMMLFGVRTGDLRVRAGGLAEPLELVHRFSAEECYKDWMGVTAQRSLAVVRADAALVAGAVVEITGLSIPPAEPNGTRFSGTVGRLELARIDAAHDVAFELVSADTVEIRTLPGPPVSTAAYTKPDGRIVVVQFDRCSNPIRNSGTDYSIRSSESLRDRSARDAEDHPDAHKNGRIELSVPELPRGIAATPRPIATDGTPIWFGDLHWHTDFSDGSRPLDEALAGARDGTALDFATPADHMGVDGTFSGGARPVSEYAAIARSFNEPGRFCVLPAAELGGRMGHALLLADDPDLFVELCARIPTEAGPYMAEFTTRNYWAALARLCPPGRAIVSPTHPVADSGGVLGADGLPLWGQTHWPIPPERSVFRCVELYHSGVCSESEHAAPEWHVPKARAAGTSVQTALARGYRLGFVGGSDAHHALPGQPSKPYFSLTAVAAPALDTQSVFRALHGRRCYATTGTRIVADATLNGQPFGSELRLAPGAPRVFRIRIRGTAPIAAVEIVHGGAVLADLPVGKDSPDFDAEWADERPGRAMEEAYYYVRARQTDGHCVWLSPFWVDLP